MPALELTPDEAKAECRAYLDSDYCPILADPREQQEFQRGDRVTLSVRLGNQRQRVQLSRRWEGQDFILQIDGIPPSIQARLAGVVYGKFRPVCRRRCRVPLAPIHRKHDQLAPNLLRARNGTAGESAHKLRTWSLVAAGLQTNGHTAADPLEWKHLPASHDWLTVKYHSELLQARQPVLALQMQVQDGWPVDSVVVEARAGSTTISHMFARQDSTTQHNVIEIAWSELAAAKPTELVIRDLCYRDWQAHGYRGCMHPCDVVGYAGSLQRLQLADESVAFVFSHSAGEVQRLFKQASGFWFLHLR